MDQCHGYGNEVWGEIKRHIQGTRGEYQCHGYGNEVGEKSRGGFRGGGSFQCHGYGNEVEEKKQRLIQRRGELSVSWLWKRDGGKGRGGGGGSVFIPQIS